MRILLLSTYDIKGGAARAAYRLCEGLTAAGHEVKMLVQSKSGNDGFVEQPDHFSYRRFSKIRGYLDLMPAFIKTGKKVLFSIGWLPSKAVIRKINDFDPDVVHLHWVNKGFFNLQSLADIRQPVIWTLHDMWAFTGGCHYAYDCERYTIGCGKCPVLRSGKESDMSLYFYKRKKVIYKQLSSLTIVTPSNWMAGLARKSGIFGEHRVLAVPNAINAGIYHRTGKSEARKLLGLPGNMKLILFNAMNATTDERKGYRYLLSALESMDLTDVGLVIVGSDRLSGMEPAGLKVHLLGLVKDTETMVKSYNACDVFVLPSLQDNLPNTVMESLACGTPVVAFNTGGIPDMVEHKKNGYLAEYKSVNDLANGIKWSLYEADAKTLSDNARQKVLDEFAEEVIILKHAKLYQELLNQ
jgi:glycosyltransferase involved in cell wall biosynthesis